MKYRALAFVLLVAVSCKTHPDSARRYEDNDPKKVYHLRLNPTIGSKYTYTITKGSEFELEVDGKKVDNKSQSTMDITYTIGRDSAGNLLMNMAYNKIHLYTKNGDKETEMDADNTETPEDPVEKMLALLKGTNLQAVLTPGGQMISLNGYDAVKEKVLGMFNPGDTYMKQMAGKQWDQRIKENLIRGNMDQFFRIFPDSAVHVGDRWKLNNTQNDQIALTSLGSYQLKSIEDGTAVIHSEGRISADNAKGEMNGYQVASDLKGDQQGEFDMEAASGMLLRGFVDSKMAGTLEVMGRDIPVTISTSLKMEGRKLQ